MKVKNKATGEIAVVKCNEGDDYFYMYQDDGDFICPVSLEQLYQGWEDYYEEPKEYWYIDDTGVIQIDQVLSSVINMRKSIGNYFETEEEAQQAVEKLKAWKRLKDKGFVFNGVNEDDGSIKTGLSKGVEICKSVEFYEDMTLLFGGEE